VTARIADPLTLLEGATPGPWFVPHGTRAVRDSGGRTVAECWGASVGAGWPPGATKANARLIAAAPDLARDLAEARAANEALRKHQEKFPGLCSDIAALRAQVAELAGALSELQEALELFEVSPGRDLEPYKARAILEDAENRCAAALAKVAS